jgi:hypothetical protein
MQFKTTYSTLSLAIIFIWGLFINFCNGIYQILIMKVIIFTVVEWLVIAVAINLAFYLVLFLVFVAVFGRTTTNSRI